ncbi:MAG: hypothetical protein RLY40_1444 [Pseudomonadota bacterium]|jgi:hypothetical protein
MKLYFIKNSDAALLKGLNGLHWEPDIDNYTPFYVKDFYNLDNLPKEWSSLSKNCDSQLVRSVLKQMQRGQASFATIQNLKSYLQYAEKKDKEGKSDFVKGIEKFFLGLLYVTSAMGGFLLMTILMGLVPAYGAWVSLLIIPIVAVAAYGIIKSLIGVFQCVFGIFSACFQPKEAVNNTKELQELEMELQQVCLQPSSRPHHASSPHSGPTRSLQEHLCKLAIEPI